MSGVDLSLLPPPAVVETIDYEALLASRKARFIALAYAVSPEFGAEAEALMSLESEPAVKILEEASYEEILERQRVNEAALAVLLATAKGSDLEHLAALYGVSRLVTDPGDPDAIPPIPPTLELDDALRARVQMAPEGFSTAGPSGAYRFHTLSADGQVLDAAIDSPRFESLALSPEQLAVLPAGTIALRCTYDAGLPDPRPGMVRVTVLARGGDGTPDGALLATVATALNDEDVRPLTDEVVVTAPAITHYALHAELVTYPGPSAAAVLEAAQATAQAYVALCHRLDYDVTLSGLYAALHRPGVQRVNLIEPAATVVCGKHQAAYCTGITLTLAGTDV